MRCEFVRKLGKLWFDEMQSSTPVRSRFVHTKSLGGSSIAKKLGPESRDYTVTHSVTLSSIYTGYLGPGPPDGDR